MQGTSQWSRRRTTARCCAVGVALFMGLAQSATGDSQIVKTWTNAAGGSWQTATNWSPSGVPLDTDVAQFGLIVTQPITLADAAVVQSLLVLSGSVELALGGSTLTVGAPGVGSLHVGTTVGAPASLRVVGTGTESLESRPIAIATVPGTTGALTLANVDVQQLFFPFTIDVGLLGDGSLMLEAGASVQCTTFRVATAPGATGSATLKDASSLTTSQTAQVGTGVLTILDTSVVSASPKLTIFPNGTLRGDGTALIPNCALSASRAVENFGDLTPGIDVGTFKIVGNYKQYGVFSPGVLESGSLTLQATTANGPVENDLLTVQCSAELAGLLELQPFRAFDPPIGSELLVLTADSLIGEFDVVLLPGLPDRFITIVYESGLAGSNDGGVAGSAAVKLIVEPLAGGVAFGTPAVTGIDGEAVALGSGDIDGEGDLPDIAVALPDAVDPAGADGTLLIFFDVGTSGSVLTIGSSLALTTERLPSALDVADIDGNGSDDVAVANAESNSVNVYFFGAGTTVVGQVVLPVGDKPLAVGAGAIASKDELGLVVANGEDNSLSVFEYDGKFGFENSGTLPTAEVPCSVDYADMDQDGDQDALVTNNGSNSVSIFVNAGGLLQVGPTFTVGTGPIDVSGADLNGDGFPEIVTSNAVSGTVSVLRNLGTPGIAFQPTVDLPIGAAGSLVGSLAVVDIGEDADGDSDIVVIGSDPADPKGPRVLRVLRNDTPPNGTITFTSALSLETGGDASVVTTADLGGDGATDLVVLNETIEGLAGLFGSSLAGIAQQPSSCADLDQDGSTGPIDLGILLGAWGTPGPGDFDRNGSVGPEDLAVLLGCWSSPGA